MNHTPSDNAHCYRHDGIRMIRYTAMPVDIPQEQRNKLISLGNQCCIARTQHKPEYVRLHQEFDRYERQLRQAFGVEVERPEYWIRRDV